jgi:Family of unknown function (DUF6941)
MSGLKVQSALVCEDVRREDNGKLILLGVFGNDIRVAQMPANLVLALVVRLEIEKPFRGVIEFQCLVDGTVKFVAKGQLHVPEVSAALFTVPNIAILNIERRALLEFQWRVEGGDWDALCSFPIVELNVDNEQESPA